MSASDDKEPLQLGLSFSYTDKSLHCHFEDCLDKHVSLVLTDNSTSVLSVRMKYDVMHVRLHKMFLSAAAPVIDEIVTFLKRRRGKMPLFRKFLREQRDQLQRKMPNKVAVRMAGKFHHLRELYDEINREYFEGAVTAAITWGTRSSRSAVRKRTLGSYSERSNTIRINPVLDKRSVPRYYVALVVYHEMLHAAIGISIKGERRSVHSREFRRREKLFKEYDRAMAWERER